MKNQKESHKMNQSKICKYILMFIILALQLTYTQLFAVSNNSKTLFLSINYKCDSRDSMPIYKDPLEAGWQEMKHNSLDFLINDTSYYPFTVFDIHKYKQGYGIWATTRLHDTNIYVYIISIKGESIKTEKVKQGQTYRMNLKRYYEHPLATSAEFKQIYDVMLNEKNVGILSIGQFSYLFVTNNLVGLHYVDSVQANPLKKQILDYSTKLQVFVNSFVKAISFSEDSMYLSNYVDTNLIKKALNNYYEIYGGVPLYVYKRPPSNIEHYNWKLNRISTSSFQPFFWGMLKYFYKFPYSNNEIENYCFIEDDIEMKVLHYVNNVYTIRLKWKLSSSQKMYYYAIITVKQTNDSSFKVIGFNKPPDYWRFLNSTNSSPVK